MKKLVADGLANNINPSQDSLEEVFENRDPIDLAKSYEKLPKPTLLAIKEFEDNKIYFKREEEDSIENV